MNKIMPKYMKRKDVSDFVDLTSKKLEMTKQGVEFVMLSASDLLLI